MIANLIEMTIWIEKYLGCRIHQKRAVVVDTEKDGKFQGQLGDNAFRVAANQPVLEIVA